MRKAALLLLATLLVSQAGCLGLLIDLMNREVDNLVVQKDFRPDPEFGAAQLIGRPAGPLSASQIAKIPGSIWLEFMGDGNASVGSASGFMVEFAGKPHIASAGHICLGPEYKAVYAYFSEGRERPEEVEIVFCDEILDVALLRFKNDGFRYDQYPRLGSSADLAKGDKIFTHGSPFGYEFSLSEGIIDKLDYGPNDGSVQPQVIHHSAKINPGDSGGPLYDERGRIVGMNVMGYHPSWRRDVTTIYGAIPIDDIVTVLRKAKKSGHAEHAQAGWQVYPSSGINPLDYRRKGFPAPERSGLVVWKLVSGGPAETAGLKVGDVLLSCDGRVFTSSNETARYVMFGKEPGDEMRVSVYREVRWTDDRLEKNAAGEWEYNHYPRMERKVLDLVIRLEKK